MTSGNLAGTSVPANTVRALFFGGIASLIAISSLGTVALAAPPKTKVDKPAIACGTSTQTSINIQVCAGATGAPAGFSLQWMTAADYAANGGMWFTSDDPRLCKASFSGNASLSRYNLTAGQCVTVNVGEFLFDNGASSNCIDALLCGTTYEIHAFSHATNTLMRSDFTSNLECSTLPCEELPGDCTLTQGYWKTHTPLVCDIDPGSPLCISWPVSSLTLGTVSYDVAQLLSILNTPASGNGLLALAHQLIAAKLNVANGADATDATALIAAADALIGSLVIPPVGSGYLAPSATSLLTSGLTNYNEGATGPGHCN